MDLGGNWRAIAADDEARRTFSRPETDASDWPEIAVPGHWRTNPAFADNDGPLLYRHEFSSADFPFDALTDRAWLTFEGIFYQGDIWLDGLYLGDTEGYFTPQVFEVTNAIAERHDHVVAAEVTCNPQRTRTAKRNLTGVFQHWDSIDPNWNPGGLWRPVTVTTTGQVKISRLRVLCLEANRERAVLSIRAILDSSSQHNVRIRSSVDSTIDEQEHSIAKGSNRVEWKVTVERPKLWWPIGLGEPELTDVCIEVINPATEMVSDARRLRTGLRQVRRDNWIWQINGERLYLKGANLGPTRMAIGDATPQELRHDLELARAAGLNMIRLHAHVSHPAIYEAADEMGMMIWQDMPLQWGYARSVRKQAIKQASELVDVAGHHPSIIHWCGHNEPLAVNVDASDPDAKRSAEMAGRYLMLQELPTWNKSVLDFGIHRSLTKSDPSRPITAHSGILPGPTSGGTDTHLYFGWYHGHERDFPRLIRSLPRLARFISEFGAQAIPTNDSFLREFVDGDNWPDSDWAEMSAKFGLQAKFFDRNVAPADYPDFDTWKAATQQHQATILQRHIEELRRIKYHPNGGFALFSLADALDHACVSWAIFGHDREPKLAYHAVAKACSPVIVTADRPPAVASGGTAYSADIHVVSDLRHVLKDARLDATLSWPGGRREWAWVGTIGADTVNRIGTIDFMVPRADTWVSTPDPQAPQQDSPDRAIALLQHHLELEIRLTHPAAQTSNSYSTRLVD